MSKPELKNNEVWDLYEDEQLTKKVEKIDWGRPWLGEAIERTYYLVNHSEKCPLVNFKLNQHIAKDEIRIKNMPELIAPKEVYKLDVVLQGKLSRREALEVPQLLTAEFWIG